MLILDTNVVSEITRSEPDARVLSWLDRQDESVLFTTAVTIHEMRFGIECLPEGRRRRALARSFERLLQEGFGGKVLNVDESTARQSGKFQAHRKRIGQPINLADCLIAGIAATWQARLVTRNVKDFGHLDLGVINPWPD